MPTADQLFPTREKKPESSFLSGLMANVPADLEQRIAAATPEPSAYERFMSNPLAAGGRVKLPGSYEFEQATGQQQPGQGLADWLTQTAGEMTSPAQMAMTIPLKGRKGEYGKTLTKEQRQKILESVIDAYEGQIKKTEFKRVDERTGAEIFGYPYTPELFRTSDVTGAKVRYFIKLPDGRIAHPSELYPEITQSHVDEAIAARIQAEKFAAYQKEQKLSRIAASPNEANANFVKTGRKIPGTFFAKHPDGRIVRVDGKDASDVEFYQGQGFVQSSPTVPSQ